MNSKLMFAMAGAALLSACGGDNQGGDGNTPPSSTTIDYTKLKVAPQSDTSLALIAGDSLSQHIKNGLRLKVSGAARGYREELAFEGGAVADAAAPPAPAAGDSTGGGGNFSQTNVHVAGVDEADFAKYDGEHWFVATYPEYEPYRIDNFPGINVVATNPAAPSAEVVGHVDLESEWGGISEMYLVADGETTSHVAAIQNQWGNVYPVMPGFGFPGRDAGIEVMALPAVEPFFGDVYYPHPVNSEIKIRAVDVVDAAAPSLDWTLTVEGSLIDSRKVGDMLYLVTRFDPWIANLQFENGAADVREANEDVLSAVNTQQLLPTYRINDGEAVALSDGCYVQELSAESTARDYLGYASLVNITAINLAEQQVVSSRCLNSAVEALSVNPDSMYLTGTVWGDDNNRQKTVIHKFLLDETGASYAASGSVKGYVGVNSDPAFKMHQHNGDLRIVTTTGRAWDNTIAHHLTILEDNNGTLSPVATLPNAQNPAPIGKPGEDIYSVRFEGDRGYIVTFQRTDPLYALDLSDRTNPQIAGELEVPGFATYMHPIGDNYLFAVGQDADENGRVTSLKVALMDVSGDSPKAIDTILLGARNSSSEALNNLHALSFVTVGDELRIAMPVNYYAAQEEGGYGQWQHTGLHLFKVVDIDTDSARLLEAGVIKAEQASETQKYPAGSGNDRGIFHDDAIFYAHANGIWSAKWGEPENASGPVYRAPTICTADVRPALNVTVSAPGGNACAAKVSAVNSEQIVALTAHSSEGETCAFSGADEMPGQYYVEASLDNFSTESESVVVYRDICHVITENVAFEMTSYQSGCPELRAPPSVKVYVNTWDFNVDACADASVVVTQNGQSYELQGEVSAQKTGEAQSLSIAPPEKQCLFTGANGVSGEVSITASLEGWGSQEHTGIFIRQRDRCSVETVTESFYF
ncbi:MAG TPA: beta-propeller domain-containing protein [Marinagarivorans sp.]